MGGSRRDGLEEALARMREAMLWAERTYLEQLGREGSLPARPEAPPPAPRAPPEAPDRRATRRERRRGRARHRPARTRPGSPSSSAEGWVFLVMAVALLLMALTHRGPWWFVFVSLGLGLSGARRLGLPRSATPRRVGTAPIAPPVDPDEAARTARLDRVARVCDRLVEDVRTGPALLRELVGDPSRTVVPLKDACQRLIHREADLRRLLKEGAPERLERERAELVARLEAETDPVAREGFGAALEALDEQRRHREELRALAARLEAESVRLTYTLESLHAQVLRVRGADAAGAEGASAGLRRSVARLEDTLSAVAEALEWVGRSAPEGGDEPSPRP